MYSSLVPRLLRGRSKLSPPLEPGNEAKYIGACSYLLCVLFFPMQRSGWFQRISEFNVHAISFIVHTCTSAYTYICTYTCTHTHTHTYTHTCIRTYILMYAHMLTCTHIYTHMFTCIHIRTYIHMCTYIHVYTYICTYIHACMHAYVHVYTYIHNMCVCLYIHTYILRTYIQTYIHTYVHTFIPLYTLITSAYFPSPGLAPTTLPGRLSQKIKSERPLHLGWSATAIAISQSL